MSNYTDTVEHNLDGLRFVSTGPCIPELAEFCCWCERQVCDCEDREDETRPLDGTGCMECAEFSEDVGDEGGFSWSPCGICGSPLGGTRYVWHWVDKDNAIIHEHDACADCVMYLANGDEPENWGEV